MTDWTTDIQSIDLAALDGLDPTELCQPWTDAPDIRGPEVDSTRRLPEDLAHYRTPTARTLEDFRTNPEAYRHLARLPVKGESLHAVISGKYALWELVPAILDRSGNTIEHLHIATLSFNDRNSAELLALLDAQKIKAVTLLVSQYFKATSPKLYANLVPQLIERGQPVLAMRTHAKMLLLAMSSGERYTVESSANLRSATNIEQFVMSNDDALYEFHRTWIEDIIHNHGKETP